MTNKNKKQVKTIENIFFSIKKSLPKNIKILAISKNQDISSIKKLYKIGQRDFGENYIQEMIQKYQKLPKDIRWHMTGIIQSNKLKYIIPFINLIHSVQKMKHIQIINKEASKYNRIIKCLLQIKICKDKNKTGITNQIAKKILEDETYKNMKYVKIIGLMGISSFQTTDEEIEKEFFSLNQLYKKFKKKYKHYILSMGMSKDYPIAIKNGSNCIRLGEIIFGKREKRTT
ncbi:YggS family pyridoxal phosphate-dependent enzyme [Blattabacterium cuenoti]|uniref:YggS family pyridoxal phosphate-dependent enzyme n=1 Tax=Blattabacterium cuenoti TaxID=1653831 RepID=UPI00163D296D|nr:YggS family pyridoxal phosphate-dependent enzyme [Blattabacterium cuenoti]